MIPSNTASPGPRRRILIISQFYHPDITAAAFRIKETADLLASRGHSVHVIAGEPHKARAPGEGPLTDGRVKVTRVKLFKAEGKGTWNYIRHYMSFMLGAIYASWKHPSRFDIVWASSPPLFTGVAGLVISKLKKARFALDIRDIWPESAVVAGQLSAQGNLFQAAKIVERTLYKSADIITCVARPMAGYISGIAAGKQPAVIYNGIPRSYFDSMGGNDLDGGRMAQAPGELEILYVGNMGHVQSLSVLIEAANLLQREGATGIRFVLVGEGAQRKALVEQAGALGLKNVSFTGILPKAEALRRMRECSALVLLLKADGTMDKTIPSKVFDYMAAGRPVLFGLGGEGREIFSRVSANMEFSPDSSDSLAAAVRRLRDEYPAVARTAAENREIVRREFLREAMVDRLEMEFQCTLEKF